MKESDLLKKIQLAATHLGARLLRNNVGTGWVGNTLRVTKPRKVLINPGDVVVRSARPLHAGLSKGSSDLIGWTPVIITEEHLGKKLAVFTAIEGKTGNLRLTKDQSNFLGAIRDGGGIAAVVRQPQDIYEVLNEF